MIIRKMSCKKGYIERDGYRRKAYTRADGTRVKSTYVGPTCVKDTGSVGKGPKLIGPLRHGTLTQFGYAIGQPMAIRRQAVKRAVKKYGALPIFRKLNVVATLQKNTNPVASRKFKADAAWVKKTYMI